MESELPNNDLTKTLEGLVEGRSEGVNQLLPQVYARLHEMAKQQLAREDVGHTLQPTALLHEAYLKLVDQKSTKWQNEAHFLAVAATAMRRILIDHARGREREKRGGSRQRISITNVELAMPASKVDVLALDEALERLAKADPVAARIVEMRFFAGMEMEWIAQVLGMSDRTARRHWVYAKAWIARELLAAGSGEPNP